MVNDRGVLVRDVDMHVTVDRDLVEAARGGALAVPLAELAGRVERNAITSTSTHTRTSIQPRALVAELMQSQQPLLVLEFSKVRLSLRCCCACCAVPPRVAALLLTCTCLATHFHELHACRALRQQRTGGCGALRSWRRRGVPRLPLAGPCLFVHRKGCCRPWHRLLVFRQLALLLCCAWKATLPSRQAYRLWAAHLRASSKRVR